MKTLQLLCIALPILFFSSVANAQLSGKYVIKPGGNYSTLKEAADAYNSQGVNGNVTFSIEDDLTETGTSEFSGTAPNSMFYTLTITTDGVQRTINGNIAGPLIQFKGANNITIDGGVAVNTSSIDMGINNTKLVFKNTNTTGSACVLSVVKDGVTDGKNVFIKNASFCTDILLPNGSAGIKLDATASVVEISGCYFSKAAAGIKMNNVFSGKYTKNVVRDVGRYGICDTVNVAGAMNLQVDDNDIQRVYHSTSETGITSANQATVSAIAILSRKGTGNIWIRNNTLHDVNNEASGSNEYIWSCGIWTEFGGTDSISGNKISKLRNTKGSYVRGIIPRSFLSGSIDVRDCEVRDLKGSAQVNGIYPQRWAQTCASYTVEHNVVDMIESTGTSGNQYVAGIVAHGTLGKVLSNTVSNVKSNNWQAFGIQTQADTDADQGNPTLVANNMIHSIKAKYAYGMRCTETMPKLIVAHNTICMMNNDVPDAWNSNIQYGNYNVSKSLFNEYIFKNNILINKNNSYEAGSYLFYDYTGIRYATITDFENNHPVFADNRYDSDLTSLMRVNYSNTNKVYTTLPDWTASAGDNSTILPITLVSATDLHLSGASKSDLALGVPFLAGLIEEDFDGDLRYNCEHAAGADNYDIESFEVTSLSVDNSCCNKTIFTATVINGSGNYQYSIDNGLTWMPVSKVLDASNLQITVSPRLPEGTSTLYIKDGSGCVFNYDYTVTTAPVLVATISGATEGCSGKEYIFTSNGTRDDIDYVWTVTNGTVVWGQGTNEVGVTFTKSGTVTVKYKSLAGCESTEATFDVLIQQLPQVSFMSVFAVCSGSTLEPWLYPKLKAGGDVPITRYFWTLDGMEINPYTYKTTNADNGKALRYNLSTAYCGVVSSTPIAITVKSKPTIIETLGLPDTLCLGSQVNATVKAVHDGDQPLSYQWMLNGAEIGNADNLTYTPVLADHGRVVTVNASNECGTATTQHAVIISGNQTIPSNNSLAQTIDLPNGYFTRPLDAANAEQMQLPDKYWENTNYIFYTLDNSYTDGSEIWLNRTSVTDQWVLSSPGIGYKFKVWYANTNAYTNLHTRPIQNTTIVMDEGTYMFNLPAGGDGQIIQAWDSGVKIFGLKNVIFQSTVGGAAVAQAFRIAGSSNNVVENVTIDGGGNTFTDYAFIISEENSPSFRIDYLTMKDITVRNAVSKAAYSNRSIVVFIGMNGRGTGPGTKTQMSYARIHNLTIEETCKTTGTPSLGGLNGAVQLYGASNLYFKNLDVRYIPSLVTENPLQMTIGSTLTSPSRNIVFDGLTMSADSITVQRFIPHDLAFSDDYRYVRYQLGYLTTYYTQKLFKTMPGYYNNTNIVYDKQDGYWIIPSDGSTSARLNSLRDFYTNYKSNNNNSLLGAPMPNIKLVANVSGEIGNGFTVPDFGIDAQVNIVAVKNATDPASQDTKVVFNPISKISFNATGASKVNLYNIDFDQKAKYTLPTIQDSVANSKAGNFYNCIFSSYGDGEQLKINIANAPFTFADEAACVQFDLKDLTLVSGDTTGLTLKYYDMNDVELQSTTVFPSTSMTSYKVVGAHSKGCSYTTTVKIIRNCRVPKIKKDLDDAVICLNGSHTWIIEAEGDNLTYEWYKGEKRILGENSPIITISDADFNDYDRYYVVVRSDYNGFKSSVQSKKVRLWVADYLPEHLKLAEYPNPATVGKTYHLKVDGYIDVTKYSWSYSKDGVIFSPAVTLYNDNETWATFGTLSAGTGILKVTMEHPCGTRELTQTITVNYPTGVEDLTAAVVTVYPNPTSGILKVSGTADNQIIRVADITGSLKGNYKTQEGTTLIDLTGYAKGTYLVQYNGKIYKIIKK